MDRDAVSLPLAAAGDVFAVSGVLRVGNNVGVDEVMTDLTAVFVASAADGLGVGRSIDDGAT